MTRKHISLLLALLLLLGCASYALAGALIDFDAVAPAKPWLVDSVVTPNDAARATEGAYVVLVTDEAGQPVPGVMIQICDEGTCMVAVTDETGMVTHNGDPYPYEFHVLKAPEGYAKDDTAYLLPEEGGELTIILKK